MGWDGAGAYNRQRNFSADASAGIKILASGMDQEINDVASAFTLCWARDGQNTPTQDISMGGFRLLNVGKAQSVNGYMRVKEFIENVPIFMDDTASSADRISVSAEFFTSVSAAQAPADGVQIFVRANSDKGSAVLYLDGHSANVIDRDATRVGLGALTSGEIYQLTYSSAEVAWRGGNQKTFYAQTPAEVTAGKTPANYEYEPGNVLRYGTNTTPGTTDMTAAFQAALDASEGSVFVPDGKYVIDGTITMPAGVTLWGRVAASEYFPGEGANAQDGALLLKDAGSTDGPIIQMTTGAGLQGIYLKHEKTNGATTGIIQMGATGTAVTCYNTKILNVRMYGHLTEDVAGTTTCYGIFFPQSISTAQRYFNSIHSVYVTNCDVAFHLDEESNGNNFTGIVTRQCYHHYQLDGNAGACVDNIFSGLGLFNVGSLPTTQEKGFVLTNSAQWNNFIGYQTELNGQAFDIDSTSTLNMWLGQENEPDSSIVPVGGVSGPDQGSIHSKYQRPINVEQYSQMLLPSLTTGAQFDTSLIGSKLNFYQEIDGTANGLPALNGAGTLVAATAHSRSIVQFNISAYERSVHPNFRCKLTLFVQAAGTSGQAMTTVEFMYCCTDTSTDAGVLRVLNVEQAPAASNYISGLKFIDGVTGGTEFRIAMVGGNLSAALATRVIIAMEIECFKPAGINTNLYANLGFVSTAATANDVTDAIDLLTVADTVV